VTDPLEVDEIASYAHRVDDGVRLVLHVPGLVPDTDEVRVRLWAGDQVRQRPASVRAVDGGTVLELVVPVKGLGHRVWRLAVAAGGDGTSYRRLQARLLTSSRQPVALITGPMPRTVLPEPSPRRRPRTSRSTARRIAGRIARDARRTLRLGRGRG
jgi:hypothetical protein